MRILFLFFAALGLISTISTKTVQAQTITEDFPFNYGTLVVIDNTSVQTMRIRRNGNINPISAGLVQIGTVSPARYDFRGFAPNTNPTFSFTPTTLNGPGGNFFTLTNFEFPNNMTTNNAGNRFNRRVGSRINTSGNGMAYTDGTYSGTVLLNITYP